MNYEDWKSHIETEGIEGCEYGTCFSCESRESNKIINRNRKLQDKAIKRFKMFRPWLFNARIVCSIDRNDWSDATIESTRVEVLDSGASGVLESILKGITMLAISLFAGAIVVAVNETVSALGRITGALLKSLF